MLLFWQQIYLFSMERRNVNFTSAVFTPEDALCVQTDNASMAVFILEDALSDLTNLAKHLQFIWLCVSSIKTGTRRIMHVDPLSFEISLERRATKGNSPGRITCLAPVFILETHNPDELQNVCLSCPDG